MKNLFFTFLMCLLSALLFSQNQCDHHNIGCHPSKQVVSRSIQKSASAPCVLRTIPSPTAGTVSLAYDGNDLWVGSFPNQIHKISTVNGALLKTINTTIQRPYGLEFVDGYLWVTENDSLSKVHKIDTSNGNTILTHNTLHQFDEAGLAWDGAKLWHCSRGTKALSYIDTALGSGPNSNPINLFWPSALAFQGNYLWISDNFYHKIYKMDTATFAFVDTIDSPKLFPNGLAYDGQYMWIADNQNSLGIDSIYQIDLNCQTTSVAEYKNEHDFVVYPNPTDGIFTIDLNKSLDDVSITILDLRGKMIQSQVFNNSQLLNIEIEAPSGFYLLMIESEGQKTVTRLVNK